MGTVVISLDAELGWGFHHVDELPGDRIRNARENWRWLLELFDEYEIPATWAVVGRLLGDEPGLDRPEHPEDESMFEAGAPGASADETWVAGDLVDYQRLRDVVDYVDWRRAAGDLEVATMAEVADRTRAASES